MITSKIREELAIILNNRFLNKNISEDLLIKSIISFISEKFSNKDISIILDDFQEEIINIAKKDFLTIKNISGRKNSFLFKLDEKGIDRFTKQFIILFEAIIGDSNIIEI
ncbi:MAG: hypothetical protein C0601_06515 [Candidatus Muiribacterium halophilum]|uniref:Uncharacterized protein n=1 Tax=Muiribacterium halophilum TaxID=2053465 RepID=A0A2N5ZG43_MUIH1|nr:MAG: hypothetical protein C0601_06515 [Candidatus Muirbacterium halophilum]